MNIKLVHWPINNIGGILTWIREIDAGFTALGHQVDRVCPADYHPRPETLAQDDYYRGVPQCRAIPTVSDQELDACMAELNSADLVIFCHPSPHHTKDQRRRVAEGRRWVEVYRRLTAPRLVVFHDNNWAKTNAWFADVAEYVPFVLAAQHIFMESVEKYPTRNRRWEYFPIRVPQLDPSTRRVGGLMATQWLKWKRHREFMNHVPALSNLTVFDLYNIGIEYWHLRKEAIWAEYVGEETVVQYKGTVDHSVIIAAMQQAIFCVDFSKRGYTNYTHWEPLCCGAISMTHEDVLANPYCELPRTPMVVDFNDTNFIERVEAALAFAKTPACEDARRATVEACRERMEPTVICQRILEELASGLYTL